jgi:hypothetical protein
MSNDNDSIRSTRDLIFHSDDWFTADELNRRLAAVANCHSAFELEHQRRIFSVQRDGYHYFAAYQFNADFEPLPIIREILTRLVEEDCWAIAAWFHFPNAWLARDDLNPTPMSPKDALGRHDEVLRAAERFRGTYVA